MIRARAGGVDSRPARLILLVAATLACVAACSSPSRPDLGTAGVDASSSTSEASGDPSATLDSTPATATPGDTATPNLPTETPVTQAVGCSGSDDNRGFFRQAANSMDWAVYCAVLDGGWFLEDGDFALAGGGRLNVTYRGPGDAHLAIVEGRVCPTGTDVDACAPRDSVIGPAEFGDQAGELGRLANGLVLDVDRGANPSWRSTGLGLSEDEFRAISAAFIVVEG